MDGGHFVDAITHLTFGQWMTLYQDLNSLLAWFNCVHKPFAFALTFLLPFLQGYKKTKRLGGGGGGVWLEGGGGGGMYFTLS